MYGPFDAKRPGMGHVHPHLLRGRAFIMCALEAGVRLGEVWSLPAMPSRGRRPSTTTAARTATGMPGCVVVAFVAGK